MNTHEAFEIAQAFLISLGGAGVIILGLSSWLGKVWANRLMEKDRAKHDKELTELKTQLEKAAEHGNHLLKQKIELYQEVSEPIIELVTKALHDGNLSSEDLKKFDSDRLANTALLAMFAPQSVFDKYNNMIDYIYDSVEGKQEWGFQKFRENALIFLSEVRRDIGLYADDISYKGTR